MLQACTHTHQQRNCGAQPLYIEGNPHQETALYRRGSSPVQSHALWWGDNDWHCSEWCLLLWGTGLSAQHRNRTRGTLWQATTKAKRKWQEILCGSGSVGSAALLCHKPKSSPGSNCLGWRRLMVSRGTNIRHCNCIPSGMHESNAGLPLYINVHQPQKTHTQETQLQQAMSAEPKLMRAEQETVLRRSMHNWCMPERFCCDLGDQGGVWWNSYCSECGCALVCVCVSVFQNVFQVRCRWLCSWVSVCNKLVLTPMVGKERRGHKQEVRWDCLRNKVAVPV